MFNQKHYCCMKKNQITLMAVTFISGIVLGVSTIGLFSFTGTSQVPAILPAESKITAVEANTMVRSYYDKAAPVNEVVRGFAVNREQLSAMNTLLNENGGLSGFRVYLGFDQKVGGVGIVVGVDGSGKDVTNSIYRSASNGSGPCPTICDVNSNIISR